MYIFKFVFLFFIIGFIFISCKKIITPGLKNAPSQIVIQGEVTNRQGPYTVTINRSANFYADNIFPPVSASLVTISDNTGVTDSLTETAPGVYSTHVLQGAPNNTYTLSVWLNDTNYTATSTMPAPVQLDSLNFLQTSLGVGGNKKETLSAVANFQDPAGINNYYQFELYDNGVQYTQRIFVFSDRLSDGRYINHALRTDTTAFIHSGDTVKVRMYCIDENVYNYFYQLEQSSGMMSATPANPQSNISNGALGYFSAHTSQSITTIAPEVME
jgi:hypothetical protein